jgi:hypothetical protein
VSVGKLGIDPVEHFLPAHAVYGEEHDGKGVYRVQ